MARSKHDIIKSLIVGYAVMELCLTWGRAARLAAAAAAEAAAGGALDYVSPVRQYAGWLFLLLLSAIAVKVGGKRSVQLGLLLSAWFLVHAVLDFRNFFQMVAFFLDQPEFHLEKIFLSRWFWIGETGIRVFPRFICGVALFLYSVAGLRGWLKSSRNTRPA